MTEQGGRHRLTQCLCLAQRFIGGLDKSPVLQPVIAATQHLLLHVLDLHTGRADAGAQEGLGWVLCDVITPHLTNRKQTLTCCQSANCHNKIVTVQQH